MSNLVLENDSNESFPIDYICTSSDIKVPIGTEPVMDCVGICKKAGEFEDIEDGKNYIREKYSKCGFGEDVIQHGINALVNSKKVNESVFDSDRCLIKLKSIQFDNIYEVKRAKQARSFIDEEIFNKDGDKINKKLFITNELYNHLTLSKSNMKTIKEHCEEMFKSKKAESVEHNKDGKLPRIEFSEVADTIMEKYKIFTMRDTGEHFIYENGVYRLDISDKFISSKTRGVYKEILINKLDSVGKEIPEKIPQADTGFIHEVIAYISDMTFVSRNDVNKDVNYINFKNGLFDIENWSFINHIPELISTVQIPVNYNQNAKCPSIEKYFKECELPCDCIAALSEFAGYCLTTDKRIQKAFMLLQYFTNWIRKSSSFIPISKYFSVKCLKS